MLKKRSVKAVTVLICMVLTFTVFPVCAYAEGSVSIGATSPVNVGDNVNVTVTCSGENIFGYEGTLSYDASRLTFVSCDGSANKVADGSIRLAPYASSTVSSLSINVQLKATAGGDAALSVSTSLFINWEGVSLGTSGASKTVSIAGAAPPVTTPAATAAATATAKPAATATKTAKPTATATKTAKPSSSAKKTAKPTATATASAGLSVALSDGTVMEVITSLKKIKLPEGSEKSKIQIDGRDVECASADGFTLVYLEAPDGEKGFYVRTAAGYVEYTGYKTDGEAYEFLSADEAPKGFSPIELEIKDVPVKAWSFDGENEGCYLVYASRGGAEPEFYIYDSQQNTMQRYVERVITEQVEVPVEVTVTVTPEPTVEPTPEPTEEPKGFVARVLDDTQFFILVIALVTLLIILLIIVIFTGSSLSRLKKRMYDGDGDTDGEYSDTGYDGYGEYDEYNEYNDSNDHDDYNADDPGAGSYSEKAGTEDTMPARPARSFGDLEIEGKRGERTPAQQAGYTLEYSGSKNGNDDIPEDFRELIERSRTVKAGETVTVTAEELHRASEKVASERIKDGVPERRRVERRAIAPAETGRLDTVRNDAPEKYDLQGSAFDEAPDAQPKALPKRPDGEPSSRRLEEDSEEIRRRAGERADRRKERLQESNKRRKHTPAH